ncbi:MAG: hypothetical protein IT182_05885 [Acidobacteria bacterium]|nr:hypothetical protein [Acidobacteriota bacterium]
MKVLLLSQRPLGTAEIDRVVMTGLNPSALDVCPSIALALSRLDAFPPDLVVVDLPRQEADEAVHAMRERGIAVPVVVVAATVAEHAASMGRGTTSGHAAADRGSDRSNGDTQDADVLTWGDHLDPTEARAAGAAIAAHATGPSPQPLGVADALDAETRWLLYEVASIGHVSTTLDGSILASNDIAAQLLGHFSPDALEAAGQMPRPLLDVAGAYAQRPSRFELCLQHGEDGPLHWIVGLALPQGGTPATVTWFLIDASEQRLEARRARFLRRMDALTHVLSAATAECSTLVDTGGRALASARAALVDDAGVDEATQALSRTQAVLSQLAGFARRRARRPGLRDMRALLEQISPVLVHMMGDDITLTLNTGTEPLYVSLDAAEVEQCLAAIVNQGREALPLGGQMKISLTWTLGDGDAAQGRGARPEIVLAFELQGYGLQPVVLPPTVQTQVMRIGADLATEQPDHLTARLVLRLPRVFVTA